MIKSDVQAICWLLVGLARKHCDPPTIFQVRCFVVPLGPHPGLLQIEAEEALDRVTTALQVILCCAELTMNGFRNKAVLC